jgi:hypothetical protein
LREEYELVKRQWLACGGIVPPDICARQRNLNTHSLILARQDYPGYLRWCLLGDGKHNRVSIRDVAQRLK